MRRVATSEADRWTAWLRLLAVPVVIAAQGVSRATLEHHAAWIASIAALAAYGSATVALVRSPTRPAALDLVLPALDILFAAAISLATVGQTAEQLVLFLFAPVTTAFRLRPRATALVTAASLAVFLVHSIPRARLETGGDPEVLAGHVLARAIYLGWIGAALCGLSVLLARRERAVRHLLEVRQRLVAEAIGADERARLRLAEDLHDDVLQDLLAARHDIEPAAAADPAVAEAHEVLGRSAGRIRTLLGDLHPTLVDHAGLAVALRQVARRAQDRGLEVELAVEAEPAGPHEAILFRCARELVGNASTHASARTVRVEVTRLAGSDRLVVEDDGCGFDPATLDARLAEGHIGLLSIRERAEAIGGTFALASAPGAGTRVEVELPRGGG